MGKTTRRGVGLGFFLVSVVLVGACSSSEGSKANTPDGAAPGSSGGSSSDGGSASGTTGGAGNTGDGGRGGNVGGGGVGAGGAGGASEDDGGAASGGQDSGTAGASNGPNVDRTDMKLREFELDPKVLDPTVVDSLSVQYAQLDTRAKPLGLLVIFLPGATNVPKDWRDHGRELASFGFHVVIPHYNNRWSSDDTCTGKGNSCADDTRWEALVGEDTSSAVTIARADSAEGRVVTMIKYLVTADPGGDWGYYLGPDDAVLYGKMIIAGISHGAASAGMYAARRPFTRNVMHSSGPAGSSSAAKMTPLSEWYGFAHTDDPAYSAIISSWNSFALVGQPTSIDGQTAPYGGSHRLNSSAASTYPHGSTCASSGSPKDAAGKWVFEPAWKYLYGVPTP